MNGALESFSVTSLVLVPIGEAALLVEYAAFATKPVPVAPLLPVTEPQP